MELVRTVKKLLNERLDPKSERYNVDFNAGGPQPARPCRMCMCT
jgi:hypothetical protein